MAYKKHRTHIDNKGNKLTAKQVKQIKADYTEEHQVCECCHKRRGNVHHHVRQQYKYHGEAYVLEFKDNYSTLCIYCHAIIEHNEGQYKRDIPSDIPYKYWHELKNNQEPSFYVREYLRNNTVQ